MEFDLLNEIITSSVGVLFGYDANISTSSFSSFKKDDSIEYQASKTDGFKKKN